MNKVIEGDICTITEGLIIHQTNTSGVMGSGVALAIKKKWPSVYADYKNNLDTHGKFGDVIFSVVSSSKWEGSYKDLVVANIMGQDLSGVGTRHWALLKGLETVAEYNRERKLRVYAPELLGAALGGGNAQLIQHMINIFLPTAILVRYKRNNVI